MTYTMNIETSNGVRPHPFHLGTDLHVAESFVFEKLRQSDVLSVALYKDQSLVKIYDFRDLDGSQADFNF